MFSANRTKHLILDLVKFNPGKFFIPCLLKSTDKRLFVLLVFSVFVELFSSFVWDCLLFLSLRSIFQRSNRLIVFNFQNTTDFALCLTKTSMQRVYKVKTCLHTLTQAAKKHCDNLGYFSLLYSMWAIYSISYKAPVGQVLYEFQSSESKTYSSQMSRQVKLFCPERVQKIYNDEKALPRSGKCFWLVLLQEKFASTHGHHHCLPPFPINTTLLNLSITCSVR